MAETKSNRLIAVDLDRTIGPGPSPEAEHERRVAIYDLVEENSFTLAAHPQGPYRLQLSTTDGRLMFDILNEREERLSERAIRPLRRHDRDHLHGEPAVSEVAPAKLAASGVPCISSASACNLSMAL